MKSSIFLVLLPSLLFFSGSEVPDVVSRQFNQMFPKATEVSWQEQNHFHIATFKDYRSLKKARFNADGLWIETQIQRPLWSCPDAVIAFVEFNHKAGTVTKSAKVIAKDTIYFRIEIEYSEKVVVLDLNEGGYLLALKEIPFAFELDF